MLLCHFRSYNFLHFRIGPIFNKVLVIIPILSFMFFKVPFGWLEKGKRENRGKMMFRWGEKFLGTIGKRENRGKMMFSWEKNSQVLSEYKEIVLPSFIFMVGSTINLLNGLYHECKRMEYHFPCFENT